MAKCERGECYSCGKDVAITKRGMARNHVARIGGEFYVMKQCPGFGRLVKKKAAS